MTIEMRAYRVAVTGRFTDLRNADGTAEALLDLNDYGASQRFAVQQRTRNATGIVYPSVRDQRAECVAVFRPRVLSPATQGGHFGYVWDGRQITDVVSLAESGISPHGGRPV